jgi:hypothetical protein
MFVISNVEIPAIISPEFKTSDALINSLNPSLSESNLSKAFSTISKNYKPIPVKFPPSNISKEQTNWGDDRNTITSWKVLFYFYLIVNKFN